MGGAGKRNQRKRTLSLSKGRQVGRTNLTDKRRPRWRVAGSEEKDTQRHECCLVGKPQFDNPILRGSLCGEKTWEKNKREELEKKTSGRRVPRLFVQDLQGWQADRNESVGGSHLQGPLETGGEGSGSLSQLPLREWGWVEMPALSRGPGGEGKKALQFFQGFSHVFSIHRLLGIQGFEKRNGGWCKVEKLGQARGGKQGGNFQ